jgi:mRNA-degrading endonuclease RelE of RelBE toxin-antitoxin system
LGKKKKKTNPYLAKFSSGALEDIKALPKNTRNALKKQFQKVLLLDPVGCSEELAGQLTGFRSFHVGEYRVVFRVFEDLRSIAVVGVGRKSPPASVYKRLEILAQTGKLADTVLSTMRLFENAR